MQVVEFVPWLLTAQERSFDNRGGVQGVKVQPGLGFQASCELPFTWGIFFCGG